MEKRVMALCFAAVFCTSLVACSSNGGDGDLPPTPTSGAPTSTATRSVTRTVTLTPSVTPTPTPPPGVPLFRVAGHLGGAYRGYDVTLHPTGRVTTTLDGDFAFAEVAPGEYVVDVDDGCGVVPCWPDQSIAVVDRDVRVEIAYDACPTPALHPASGPPGTRVTFGGRCYWLHSGARAWVFLGDVLAGMAQSGDTIGNYGGSFVVPERTAPGEYVVTVSSSPSAPVGLLHMQFTVTAALAAAPSS